MANVSDAEHRILERLAYESWLRRGRPIGSPEVDWEEATKRFAPNEGVDQELPSGAPGNLPTDLGAEPPPERSHDGSQK